MNPNRTAADIIYAQSGRNDESEYTFCVLRWIILYLMSTIRCERYKTYNRLYTLYAHAHDVFLIYCNGGGDVKFNNFRSLLGANSTLSIKTKQKTKKTIKSL